MKKRYINRIILIICAVLTIVIYLCGVLWLGMEYTEMLPKVLCTLASIVMVSVRRKKCLMKQCFQNYESTYRSVIGTAFVDKPALKRMLLAGIYDYNNGKYNRAIRRLSKLTNKPITRRELVACMSFIAVSYEDSGRIHEAIEAYKKVLDIDPHNVVANNNLALLYARI